METKKRNPFLSFLLSVVAPGVGQIYNGQLKKGLWLFFSSLLIFYVFSFTGFQYQLEGIIVVYAINFLLHLYTIIDAIYISRKIKEMDLQRFQHLKVYLPLILLALFYNYFTNNFYHGLKVVPVENLGIAMESTIKNEDRVLVNPTIDELKRGDIVLFAGPDEKQGQIKRIIALAGDEVYTENDSLYINGEKADEPYILQGITGEITAITIPEGYVYVLGDARMSSKDSRAYGPVPADSILGVAEAVYWSEGKWKFGRNLNMR